jgi:hypothetical protein
VCACVFAELAEMVRRSAVEWGIAPPSYSKMQTSFTADDVKRDAKWSSQRAQKRQMLLSFNKVIRPSSPVYVCVCIYIYINECVCVCVLSGPVRGPRSARCCCRSIRSYALPLLCVCMWAEHVSQQGYMPLLVYVGGGCQA